MKKNWPCYNQALEIDPNYSDAWTNKGATLVRLGEDVEGLKSFNQALRLNPYDINAWLNKGNILMSADNFKDALIVLKEPWT